MVYEFIQAFFFIFMAEMGDKTQLLAMAFATKYSLSKVLLGVALGSFLNHGLAALLGTYLTVFIPLDTIRLLAAFAFILFGLWAFKVDEDDEGENELSSKFGPVLMVASAFFIGEMGDKTQLTVITLSTTFIYPLVMLLGTVTGMIFTSAIGVFVGSRLGKKIPEVAMKIISGTIFISFGLVSLWEATPPHYLTSVNISLFLTSLFLLIGYMLNRIRLAQKSLTPAKKIAHQLYLNTQKLQESLASIPTMEKHCSYCDKKCTIRCLQENLAKANEMKEYIAEERWNVPICDKIPYDKEKIRVSLVESIKTCQNCPAHARNCVGSQTREVLERLYFGKNIPFDGDMNKYKKRILKIDPGFFTNKY